MTLAKFIGIVFFTFGCSTTEIVKTSHYVDAVEMGMPQYNSIWTGVNAKLKYSCPTPITVKYPDMPASIFLPMENTVLINPRDKKFNHNTTLAHVTAHLCVFHLTRGGLRYENFRFIDEGIASVIGAQMNNTIASYRTMSMTFAKRKIARNLLTFEALQKWKTYFGSGTTFDYDAYYIGANFIFFVDETFGIEKRFDLLSSIEKTKNLEKSFQEIFSLSLIDLQQKWQDFVLKNYIPEPPKLKSRTPADGAEGVPTTIKELVVQFDRPMQSHISVLTRCNDGICYKNSEWRNETTLILNVDNKLLPNHRYKIELGTRRGGPMTSLEGVDLPITPWSFTTGN